MVNLIIVSHCHQLALGVKELADQMTDGTVDIVAVGGILNEDGSRRLGTDAVAISQAIQDVWSADGVVILVDLGSSILSTELALDLLPPEFKARSIISNAPLVEGAVVAALEASVGHDLESVNSVAESACKYHKVSRE